MHTERLAVLFDGLARHQRRVALGQRVDELRVGTGQLHFQRVRIERPQARDRLRVIRARRLPFVETGNAPLPQPRTLRLVLRVKLALEGVDEILGHDFPAATARKAGIVDEPDALLQLEGVGQAVGRNDGEIDGKIGFESRKAGQDTGRSRACRRRWRRRSWRRRWWPAPDRGSLAPGPSSSGRSSPRAWASLAIGARIAAQQGKYH